MARKTELMAGAAVAVVLLLVSGCSDSNVTGQPAGAAVRVVLSVDVSAPAAAGVAEDSITALGSGGTAGSLTPDGYSGGGREDRNSDDDGDRPRLTGAEILVTDLQARSVTQQRFVGLDVELPVSVDLIALSESGGEVELGVGYLPPDVYDQFVLVISSLTLTGPNGGRLILEPPGGGWTVVLRADPFEVIEGEMTTVQIRFCPRSFKFRVDANLDDIGSDDFDPEFEIEVRH